MSDASESATNVQESLTRALNHSLAADYGVRAGTRHIVRRIVRPEGVLTLDVRLTIEKGFVP